MTNLMNRAVEILPSEMNTIAQAAATLNGTVSAYHVYESGNDLEVQVQVNFPNAIKIEDFCEAVVKVDPGFSASTHYGEFTVANPTTHISLCGGYGKEGIDNGEKDVISFRLSNNPVYA